MKSKEKVLEAFRSWGVEKEFKPMREEEEWILKVRNPGKIVYGLLVGVEIFVDHAGKRFRVWTSQHRLARKIAAEHGLKSERLDGEAVVYVPASKADVVLPLFGAKVKKVLSAEAVKGLRQRAAINLSVPKNIGKSGVLGMDGA